jgi:hypothetical protein
MQVVEAPSGNQKRRTAWSIVVAGLVWSAGYGYLAFSTNGRGCVRWDMGGTPFVPASSAAAEGYFQPALGQPAPVNSTSGGSPPALYVSPPGNGGAK